MRRIYWVLLFLPFLLYGSARAELQVTLEGVSDSLRSGDQLNLRLSIEASADGHILFPDWQEAVVPFELLAQPDTTVLFTEGGVRRLQIELLTTCYRAGDHVLQPISVHWISEDGLLTDSVETEPYIIYVEGLVPDSILAVADTTAQPHHLLQQNRTRKLPYSFAEIAPWVLVVLGTAGLFFFVRWLIRRRRKVSAEVDSGPPPRPAHEIAFEELDKLRDRRLFQAGRIKEYYVELSEIIRRYVEGRFNVPAMESTSFQLLHDVDPYFSDRNLLSVLENLLSNADLAKFAKYSPDTSTCQEDLERAYHLVEKTKPRPQPILSEEAA